MKGKFIYADNKEDSMEFGRMPVAVYRLELFRQLVLFYMISVFLSAYSLIQTVS